uniref:NADH-ubiquinone oxidoreductase chain 4 n=1 Tax=Ornithodoros rostratus TaxID=360320 RepID=W0FDJ0_ORNRO|nr:NADH dehydrogenase subunit 4 [Ornithodoros rostratus]AHF21673.1 NADH dehydrogenase subunit 4 [Ornithodoros rostratus]
MLMLLFGLLWILGMYMYYSYVEIIMLLFFFSLLFFLQMDWSMVILDIGSFLGVDNMSFLLIQLSVWVSILMYLASMNVKVYCEKMFSFYILLMAALLTLCFFIMNLMGFYLFFESVLFPIVMLIVGWGSQPERLQAGLYMLFYTLFGSLPLLVFFLLKMDSLSIYFLVWDTNSGSLVLFFMGLMAFLVKMPMFLVHMWLPKAHVEAPVAGSMVLAGVLLKLGIYGMLRVKIFLIKEILLYGHYFMSITLIGGVVISLICLCQVDLKALIAYSSVCHMGMALGGILCLNGWGLGGNLLMMLGHGLCSSGLFCLANMFYERFFTRSMILLKGMGIFFPFLALWWFLFCIVNMAAPPSMNLGGEIFLLGSILKWSFLSFIPLGLMSFLSAAYSLYMFSYLNHGKGWVAYGVYLVNIREMLLMLFHFIPLVFWVFKMEFFLMWF